MVSSSVSASVVIVPAALPLWCWVPCWLFAQFLWQGHAWHLLFYQFLDIGKPLHVSRVDERDGVAFASCARGASDAVNVVLGIMWSVIVDDQVNALDVNAA